MQSPKILVYQNENCEALVEYLQLKEFKVDIAKDDTILSKLRECNFDLCILSQRKNSQPENLLELVSFIRQIDTRVPIIFLSDLVDYASIIGAFNSGVDDYVTKPYNAEELVCRIKALLKRCGVKTRSIADSYNIGSYTFYTKAATLTLGPDVIKIKPRESEILALLCAYKNEVLPRAILLQHLWRDNNYFIKRSLDVHICNLRNYFKQDKRIKINTIRGIGYSLTIEQ